MSMNGMVIPIEIALKLIPNRKAVNVILKGTKCVAQYDSDRHKIGYATDLTVCSKETHAYKIKHALQVNSNGLLWYIETDQQLVDQFWNEINLH